jgi:hypothetical protein
MPGESILMLLWGSIMDSSENPVLKASLENCASILSGFIYVLEILVVAERLEHLRPASHGFPN